MNYSCYEVASIIADLVGDNCACNFNGIDEWLPKYCAYAYSSCPNPGGVNCWVQYLMYRHIGQFMKQWRKEVNLDGT